MSLPGKSLHVGLRLWLAVGLGRTGEVALSLTGMRSVGISRYAAARGLEQLELAGLVSVNRHSGRKPVVTVVSTPAVTRSIFPVAADDMTTQDGINGAEERGRG